ncbi:MAG: hypothetical protein DWQ04_12775 [Chloroflexi bacterium]|nr:MAG: hypothetical protein DWQ04_12775 [Chloroflexota bacterium]
MVVSLGSIGLGLMWGWLLVLASRMRVKRPFIHTTSLILATIALGVVQFLFAGGPALVRLAVAIVFAAFAHIIWLRSIQQQ